MGLLGLLGAISPNKDGTPNALQRMSFALHPEELLAHQKMQQQSQLQKLIQGQSGVGQNGPVQPLGAEQFLTQLAGATGDIGSLADFIVAQEKQKMDLAKQSRLAALLKPPGGASPTPSALQNFATGGMQSGGNPLSVRNNNPGNMRPVGSNNGFQNFATPEEGLKAMADDLMIKISGRSPAMVSKFGQGYTPTLANVVSTWAPPEENDTQAYIQAVSQKTGIAPDQPLTPQDIARLQPAMIEQEGGGAASQYFGAQQEIPESLQQLYQLAQSDPETYADDYLSAQANYEQEQVKAQAKAEEDRIKAAQTAKEDVKNLTEGEGALRKEFEGLPDVKQFRDVEGAYQRVLKATKNPTAAGDVALIFNFMKMLDPGSTVREGEFATAAASAGLPDRLVAWAKKIDSGERLAPNQRQDFVTQALGQYQAAEELFNVRADQYEGLAKDYSYKPNRIVTRARGKIPQETVAPVADEEIKKAVAPVSRETPQGDISGDGGSPLQAFAYGLSGGQIPFGNVATSGIGAGIAKAAGDPRSLLELYQQAQADTKATQEDNPNATFLGNMAGVGSTLPAAFTKGIAGSKVATEGLRGLVNKIPQIGNFVGRSEVAAAPTAGLLTKAAAGTANAALRGIKGAVVAAPTAFAYGAGDAEPGKRIEGGIQAARTVAPIAGGIAAGVPLAGAALGAAAPKIDEGLRDVATLARKYKIPLSFDQISSSRALKNAQKVSQELPFSGQSGFRSKQLSAWNKAILKTVGLDADKFTKKNLDKAFTQVGKEFDDLGKGKTFVFDDNFSRTLDSIRQDASATATKDAIDNFNNVVEKRVLPNADSAGNISGEKLGKIRSEINRLARKASNIDTKELLHDLENAVIDVMTAGDDAANGALSSAKQKYKNLIVIEPLAAKGKGGNISPSLLNNRVSKVYGRSHTRGNAGEIGDLAQIGHELLPELGGSDTLQKSLYAAGGLGAAGGVIANPAVGLPAVAAATTGVGVNRALQSGLNRNQKLIDRALKPGLSSLIPPPPESALIKFSKKFDR
jgi:hypothetical protein